MDKAVLYKWYGLSICLMVVIMTFVMEYYGIGLMATLFAYLYWEMMDNYIDNKHSSEEES